MFEKSCIKIVVSLSIKYFNFAKPVSVSVVSFLKLPVIPKMGFFGRFQGFYQISESH